MHIPVYHVDAFADKSFSGNPASVCILDNWLPEHFMQSIANENHLPVTAFLVRKGNGYHTRWFTPEYEIDLCGHGSLASAYVIFNILEPSLKQADLHYSAGTLRVTNAGELLTLDFPSKNIDAINPPDLLVKGLGLNPKEVYQHKAERCLAVFETEEEVRQLTPNIEILRQLDHRGIVVTAPSKSFDFISRTFYPRNAAYEDAITGSSHCLLIPYWADKLNKQKLHAFQASLRGGELFCENRGRRVLISGKAVLYARGKILLSNE